MSAGASKAADPEFDFFQLGGLMLRRSKNGRVCELRANGWRPAPWHADRVAGRAPKARRNIERRLRQLMITVAIDGEELSAGALANRWRRLNEWAIPPLDFGAPRRFGDRSRQDRGEAAYDETLPHELEEGLAEELLAQARDGYERQGERVAGVERRAGIYQGGASISGGLVLTGSGLVAATDEIPSGPARIIMLLGLMFVLLLLLFSGLRAHQASVFTFSWSRPNIRRKVIARSKTDVTAARRSLLCALLLGQDRGQLIAKWKLARLKQATRHFVTAAAVSVALSFFYLAELIYRA